MLVLTPEEGTRLIDRYLRNAKPWVTRPVRERPFRRNAMKHIGEDFAAFLTFYRSHLLYRINVTFAGRRVMITEQQFDDGRVIYRLTGTDEALVEARLRGLI